MRTAGLAGILLSLVAAARLFAQDGSFEAQVDKNPVSLGDQFELSFTLQSTAAGGGSNFKLPDLANFRVISGPNQSTSMQFINGSVSSSTTYSYVLQPKEIGQFKIGSATIESSGQVHKTDPITIEVVKGVAPAQQKRPGGTDDLSAQIGDNLFLKAVVDRTHVLQGEQLNLTFKLYTRVKIQNYSIEKNPSLTGFWGEEIENPKNVPLSTETVGGKQYSVGVIRKMALFPTQAGTLEISPMDLQTLVQVQDRRLYDPFDAFFRDPFGRTVNYTVRSEPLKITVESLPAGAPPSFKGAVGRFSMTAKVDKQTASTNEPVSLKVTVSGTGNVKLLESPPVELPADFEQFSPKVTEDVGWQGALLSGSKTFEYLLIPRYPGNKTIPPIPFSYFDLSKKAYVSLSSPRIDLAVEQGTSPPSGPFLAATPREGVQLLSQDIRFIKVSDPTLSRRGERLYNSPLFIILSVLPLLGFAVVVVYTRQRESVMRDMTTYRNRRAMRVARRGLKQAERLLKYPDQELQFYSEITRALWKYLGDKLDIQQAEMSADRALAMITERGVDGGITSTLKSLLEGCEMARFAPTSLENTGTRKPYDEAERIIVELERTLRSK